MFKRLIFLILALAFAAPAQAFNLACGDAFEMPRRKYEQDQYGIESFDAKGFNNGSFLLEFFGPTQNKFRDWLKWLESDEPTPPPANSPGIFWGPRGLIVAKEMQFPIDAGISQARSFEGRKRIFEVMNIPTEKLSAMKGSSPEAAKDRQRLLDRVNTYLFGIYGALKADTLDNLMMRTTIGQDHTLMASLHRRTGYRVKEVFDGLRVGDPKVPSRPIKDFDRVVEVLSETADTVTVKVSLGKKPGEVLTENEELIKRMFFITHWQMVQKAYRETGLFKDNLETSIYLLDDFARSMKESQDQDIVLMYDRSAWESMRFRMSVAHRYVAVEMFGIGLQSYQYQTIPDVFYPFYPMYGVAVEKHKSGEFELKRLFHNSNPDPMKMLPDFTPAKGTNLLIHHAVAESLPPGARVKVVSKTPVHTRLYRSVGFALEKSEFNPEWNSQMETLSQTRESFLEKTRLNKK